jgi:hypothetical protein
LRTCALGLGRLVTMMFFLRRIACVLCVWCVCVCDCVMCGHGAPQVVGRCARRPQHRRRRCQRLRTRVARHLPHRHRRKRQRRKEATFGVKSTVTIGWLCCCRVANVSVAKFALINDQDKASSFTLLTRQHCHSHTTTLTRHIPTPANQTQAASAGSFSARCMCHICVWLQCLGAFALVMIVMCVAHVASKCHVCCAAVSCWSRPRL